MAVKKNTIHVDTVTVAGVNIHGYLRKRGETFHADIHLPDKSRDRFSTDERDEEAAKRRVKQYMRSPLFTQLALDAIKASGTERKDNPDASIADVADYYNKIHLKNRVASNKTVLKTTQVLEDFKKFCDKRRVEKAADIDRPLIDLYLNEILNRDVERNKKLDPKTAQGYIGIIRAALNAAYQGEIIPLPTVRVWPSPKIPEKTVEPLELETVAEILSIMREHEPELHNLVFWLARTGCRPSDAIDLRFRQVDIRRRMVQRAQKKTRQIGTYEISPEAAGLVAEIKIARGAKPDDFVFVDFKGCQWTPHRVYHQFTRALAKGGMTEEIYPYQLRHTYAFNMANVDHCPLPVLQRMMGHRDLQTTMKYVLPSDGRKYTESFNRRLSQARPKNRHAR